MSWSIALIGKPENVVKALHQESEKLSGQSKIEFDDAKPHLIGLVEQNFNSNHPDSVPVIKLTASGSGGSSRETVTDAATGAVTVTTKQHYRSCTAAIDNFYARLV